MDYYFEIADIRIRINTDIEVRWNQYIERFQIPVTEEYTEYYQCRCVDNLPVEGKVIYQNQGQIVLVNGNFEERLHFFYGQKNPCMLYKETEQGNFIYLNNQYKESFLREENYCIFNALAFEKLLLKYKGIILHSSFVIYNGQAILFTAPSGTGKSTQAQLWEKNKGALIVNGDRTILKEKNGRVYAYGLPICGSSDVCLNISVPVKAIVYLSQATEDSITDVDMKQRVKDVLSETSINFFNKQFLLDAMTLIENLVSQIDYYHLACTKEPSAVECLVKKIEVL